MSGCNTCGQGWHTVKQGTVGLAKMVAGIDRSPDELAAERLAVCRGCDRLRRFVQGLPAGADVGLSDRCDACGCFVRAKVLIAGESCPLERW